MTYEMDIAGLKRELPLCKVTDDLYIGAFVMFGDVELTVHCAAELLKRAPSTITSSRRKQRRYPCCTRWPARAERKNTSWPARVPRPICPVCSR